MTEKSSHVSAHASSTANLRKISFVDIIERLPPSMIQLLSVLAPAIHVTHHALLLITWRGGYAMRVQSWILLVTYMHVCMYGYEVLRYAPQLLLLALLGYTWLRHSFARVTGQKRAADERGSSERIRRAISQLADITDFVVALYECFVGPLYDVLTWKVPGYGPVHLVIFLLVSWPIWLLCMLPSSIWLTPTYVLHADLMRPWLESALVVRVLDTWQLASTRILTALEAHMPKLFHFAQIMTGFVQTHVRPFAVRLGMWLSSTHTIMNIQMWPPFPIASLTVRHVLLITGVIVLTWCSPWATLLRMAVWRSAFVRRHVMSLVRVLSGSESLAASLYTTTVTPQPKPEQPGPPKTSHETAFVFEIYENQRWWIGLDWTAALLPHERPSWSDSDNEAVAPPASFSLPAGTCVMMPSSRFPGKDDCRKSEWRWVDSEWHVAGVQTITSNSYKPASSVAPSDAQKVSKELSDKTTAAADNIQKEQTTEAVAQVEEAAHNARDTSVETVPDEVKRYARHATEPGVSMDVDAEGWQYGDNAWDKLSKQSGMGRYTRRRRWLRMAVLVESVEYGVQRCSSM